MTPPRHIHEALQAHFSGKATPEHAHTLEAWLREDPANIRLFVDLGLLDGLMLSVQKDEDAAAVLATLAEAEANAEPDFSLLHLPAFESTPIDQGERPMSSREARALAGFALRQALRTRAVKVGSIAAALLMGLVLGVMFLFGGDKPVQQVITDQTPTKSTPRDTVVATLTNTLNVAWAEGDSASGSPFRAGATLASGRRLTLTQGFAEFTTNRGAVVILQAPATVEFTDSDNALHLHAGRLVGICKTPASKGFTVHTAHCDVTDIGTEFGVHATEQGIEATVFAGEVVIKTPDAPSKLLTQDQTARVVVNRSGPALVVENRLAEGFTTRLPTRQLVTAAHINDPRFRVEFVSKGLRDNAEVHTDRTHQIVGLNGDRIPDVLLGGDLIRTPADARPGYTENTGGLEVSIEFASPADVYLLFTEGSEKIPAWLSRDYTLTSMRVRLAYIDAEALDTGDQPGRVLQVWQRNQAVQPGTHVVAESMTAKSAYFLVAVPAKAGANE